MCMELLKIQQELLDIEREKLQVQKKLLEIKKQNLAYLALQYRSHIYNIHNSKPNISISDDVSLSSKSYVD